MTITLLILAVVTVVLLAVLVLFVAVLLSHADAPRQADEWRSEERRLFDVSANAFRTMLAEARRHLNP